MFEHRLHSYNFSKSFIKQGIHHNEKFLSSLEIHQLFCLNASHISKTTLCVWFCRCVQWSYKTKYEKWQNVPGKIHQLYFFCISVTLKRSRASTIGMNGVKVTIIQVWKTCQFTIMIMKILQCSSLWNRWSDTDHYTDSKLIMQVTKKERKRKKSIKKKS